MILSLIFLIISTNSLKEETISLIQFFAESIALYTNASVLPNLSNNSSNKLSILSTKFFFINFETLFFNVDKASFKIYSKAKSRTSSLIISIKVLDLNKLSVT